MPALSPGQTTGCDSIHQDGEGSKSDEMDRPVKCYELSEGLKCFSSIAECLEEADKLKASGKTTAKCRWKY
jgi:hypothetical protein